VTALAAALRAAFVAIDSQFSITGTVTASTAQSLMSLVLGAAAADVFFGLLNDTFVTATPLGYSQPTLPAAVITLAGGRLSYDDLAKMLSFGGYLDPATYAALQSAAAGDTLLLNALTALQAANAQAVDAFFTTYDNPALCLWSLFKTYVAAANPTKALTTLLNGLLPVLGDLRKQEQALACATTAAGCDPSFAPALLDVAAVMPAVNPATAPAAAVADLTAIGQGGLSVQFFLTNNPSAAADKTVPVTPSLTYGPGNRLPAPNQTASGTGTVWANQSPIPLQAGALTPIQITATGLTSTFSATWETLGTGWQ